MTAFQRTVNLKKEEEPKYIPKVEKKVKKTVVSKKESIDKIYDSGNDLKEIEKVDATGKLSFFKNFMILLSFFIIGFVVFNFVLNKEKNQESTVVDKSDIWYSIKLVNDDIYYGKIKNEEVDPIILESVYYNYDQLKEGDKEINEIGNLRLVKRGQETHGPSGIMEIYKEKILFKEPLDKDSPVLEAILNNER